MTKTYVTSVLPGERFVTGPLGDVGYIAKRPGHGAPLEKMLQVRAQNRLNALKAKNERRDSKREAYLNEYYRKFDELSVRASINRMAELGMQEAEDYFKVKQNKLRRLLLEDQSVFVQEYTRKAQSSLDERLAAEKLEAEEIVKKKTNSDELRAQRIYEQMAMKNSEEFREKLRLANIKNTSDACREQIRAKEYQKRLEEEEDKAWDELREEEHRNAKLQRDREDEETTERKRELSAILERQIEDEERRRRNNACVDEVQEERNKEIRKVREDQLSRRDEEAIRRRELYEDALAKQIEANRVLAEQNLQDELLIEKIMQDDKRRKAEREAAAYRANKLEAWNELVVFKESVMQYRNSNAVAEKEAERLYEENRKMFERKNWEARRAREKARRDLRIDCVETSKRMVEDKKKKQAELKAMDFKRGELSERARSVNDRLDVGLQHRAPVDRISYNKAQSRYLTTLQNRQKLEDEEMLKKMRSLSVENSQRVKASLERPLAEIAGTSLHPFYRVIRAHDNS